MLGPVRFEDKKGDGVPTDPVERVKASAPTMKLGPALCRVCRMGSARRRAAGRECTGPETQYGVACADCCTDCQSDGPIAQLSAVRW
eukprot:264863-Prymnesium_polylepis.3